MNFILLLPHYVVWHYSMAFSDMQRISVNFIRFLFNVFSIRLLASTLFSPWQKVQETASKGAPLGDVASNIIFNFLMRIIGFFVRLMFILVGLISILVAFCLFIIAFILWLFLPFAALASVFWGIKMLIA